MTQETSFKKVYIETKGYSNFETTCSIKKYNFLTLSLSPINMGALFVFFTFYFFTKTMLSVEEGGKAKHKFAQACLDYAEVLATVNHQVLLDKLANF